MKETVTYLIFAGTSEGRSLTEYLSGQGIPVCVCVATEYGRELLEQLPGVQILQGRLDEGQMERLIRDTEPEAVVDATHPYASAATENIRAACAHTQTEYLRLLRDVSEFEQIPGVVSFDTCGEAANWLNRQAGNIFLTTGVKELPVFANEIEKKERIYARVLLREELFADMERAGIPKKQIVCMQGPFSRELNAAMLKQVNASFLVTKESGAAGGFMEKVEAARDAGAVCVVIRRPVKEEGFSLGRIRKILTDRIKKEKEEKDPQEPRTVTLVGIGMGAAGGMTAEAAEACREADCIIGAERMLRALASFGKPAVSMYRSDEIADYIARHPQYRRIVIGLSGDVGFYSGAKKLADCLAGVQVRMVCGVSSMAYFASKLGIPWEDMVPVSIHGREHNVIGAVCANRKVFVLASDDASIRNLAGQLIFFGLDKIRMTVGADLSYPTERIESGTAADFADYRGAGICAALLQNEQAGQSAVTHGIADDAFLRGQAPMTKEEVRTISVSKFRLTRDAVVYDVGAGTGSVAVECARMVPDGAVYAVERREDALALLEKNRKKFAVPNLHIVAGNAPEALTELPAPTHAFIGGSGGSLREIVEALRDKNPRVRIVVNCITLETAAEAVQLLRELKPADEDICCVSVAKARTVADYHLMTGQNPVYIISFQMEETR